MTKYVCKKCGSTKELRKATITLVAGSWVAKASYWKANLKLVVPKPNNVGCGQSGSPVRSSSAV